MSTSTPSSKTNPRPAKRPKRALSPTSAQAAQVTALFANPTQEIRLPPSSTSAGGGSSRRPLPPPPEIVTNVQGSSAGAGSGEFHVYKAARRREYERLRRMDEDVAAEQATADFAARRAEREAEDAEKTRRNREKRDKKKNKKKGAKPGAASKTGGGGAVENGDGNANKDEDARGKQNGGSGNGADETGRKDGQDGKDEKDAEGQDKQEAISAAADGPGLVIHDDD